MSSKTRLIYQALSNPASATDFSLSDWDTLIPQLRAANLLAYICVSLEQSRHIGLIPDEVRKHLVSARILAEKNIREVRREVFYICEALTDIVDRIVFLKGSAYVIAGLPVSKGRIFSDVDILVERAYIGKVENALMVHGWQSGDDSEYDQKYYRQWMHELPPMKHIKRNTFLDVHHNILPDTANLHPEADKLLQSVQAVEDFEGVYVLSPVDMFLHSATHLFQDGEFDHGLRDLVDLDGLLRHYGNDPEFWNGLVDRAKELDLSRPLYYALRYTRKILKTSIPEEVIVSANKGSPVFPVTFLMDTIFIRALAPDHPSCNVMLTGFSRWFLYVRAHYLRMPLRLLIPHLFRKATRPRNEE